MKYKTPGEDNHLFVACTDNEVICQDCGGHKGNHVTVVTPDHITPPHEAPHQFQRTLWPRSFGLFRAGHSIEALGFYRSLPAAEAGIDKHVNKVEEEFLEFLHKLGPAAHDIGLPAPAEDVFFILELGPLFHYKRIKLEVKP